MSDITVWIKEDLRPDSEEYIRGKAYRWSCRCCEDKECKLFGEGKNYIFCKDR